MLKEALLNLLINSRPKTKKELLKILALKKYEKRPFEDALDELEKEGRIFLTNRKKYVAVDGIKYFYGKLTTNKKGFGFLVTDSSKEDIFVGRKNMLDALNGDYVIVKKYKDSSDKKPEGRIIKIVKRSDQKIVGIYQDKKNFGFVVPDEHKFSHDIYISKSDSMGAADGQKVVVKIKKWPDHNKKPEGIVTDILGYPEEDGVMLMSIVKSLDIPTEFSDETLKEAKKIPQEVDPDELKNRLDLRDLTTFTIDGADSKDFDDAVSIEKKGENYLLGVHIADVSHYVRRDGPMDRDAYKRGNSVYLLDTVIPMLPFELSNGICSLNEGVDRLTLTVFMEVDKSGKRVSKSIEKSVIRSSKRLVYEDVSNFLEDGIIHSSLTGLEDDLKLMYELSQILQEAREKRGAIDFEIPESYIEVDENKWPIDIRRRERRCANKLIEEFMLLANVTVAEEFHKKDIPFIYRIHERPESEKIEDLNKFLRPLNLRLKSSEEITPMDVQELINSVKGKKEELFVSTLTLRSMQKARYSESIDIHFGLAYTDYTHFTSPIRRYADLTIHRIIKDYYDKKLIKVDKYKMSQELAIIAENVSRTELKAQEAERTVEAIKMAQYMSDRIGERFEGIISSITSFGIFVQLDNLVEGLVSYKSMDEYFEFDPDSMSAISRDKKKRYNLGDKLEVEVISTDNNLGKVDFKIVGEK